MTEPLLGPALCLPCQWVLHDACLGAITVCECIAEVLMEAEESDAPAVDR